MALTCLAADDATAWYILAIVIAVSTSTNLLMSIADAYSYCCLYHRYALCSKTFFTLTWLTNSNQTLDMKVTTIVLVVLLLSALTTELLGIHALFGAYLWQGL